MSEFKQEITQEVDSYILKENIPGGKDYLVNAIEASLQDKYALVKNEEGVFVRNKETPSLEVYDNHVKVTFKQAVGSFLAGFIDGSKMQEAQKKTVEAQKKSENKVDPNEYSLVHRMAKKASAKNAEVRKQLGL